MKADESARFTVASLRITGNTAFASDVLVALVRDELVGKSVTLAQLQAAAAKLTAYYRARGFLVARVYVPAQKIAESNAEIEFSVIEGLLGDVKLENRSRLSDSTVDGFAAQLAPGALLTLDTFERPILLLSDQAGVGGVNPVLRAGERAGTSDLVLELAPAPMAAGQVELDNHGSRFTGRSRLTGQVSLASPFGFGESFNARVTAGQGLTSALVRGEVPVGGNGWKAGASHSDTHYKLGADFAALQASGTARATGVFLSFPWVRSQAWNLNATVGLDSKRFEDRVASTGTVTPKSSRAANFTLGGDVRDPFVAGSVFVWNVTALAGRLSIDEPGARAADAATAASQGSFSKQSLALLYLQSLSRDWTAFGSVIAQRASKNLDSSEKFSLGGAQGVRAYPVGEAAGDEGVLATAELRYALAPWFGAVPSVVLFVDSGRTRLNNNPFAAGVNIRRLSAAGVGLTLTKAGDFSVRGYWAAKTAGGAATADSDRSSRLWVQAVKYF